MIVSKGAKTITIILIIVYILSPIDLFPGPVDDAIVSLIGAALVAKKSK